MFEIKAKDMRGRVGVLKTKHGDVKTPALMPVIHPRKQAVDVKKYGADIVITNAYLIYKDEDLKQKAIDEGLIIGERERGRIWLRNCSKRYNGSPNTSNGQKD